jgi:K+-sensing histidine kinase KdpD
MIHFSIENEKGGSIVSNLEDKCISCKNTCHSPGKLIEVCPIYGHKRRMGEALTNSGRTFLCDNSTKTTKLFRAKVESLSYSLNDISIIKSELEQKAKIEEQKRINRLIHNLTSINAHNIQEIYDLIPQSTLTQNFTKQMETIKEFLAIEPKHAAIMFLKISKHNIHMKSEFSIYNKLQRAQPNLEKRVHSVHKVFMNVLHTFFLDFQEKNVFVDVGESHAQIFADYESIQVALYHVIENSAKYVRHDTKIYVKFMKTNGYIAITLEMDSLYIEPEEREKIFTEGYSGIEAKKTQKDGQGIGLWRVKQMLSLNDATIEIDCGDNIDELMGFRFAWNVITLKFQQSNY